MEDGRSLWEVRLCDPCALCARVSRVCPVCVSAPPGVFLPARTVPAPPKNPLVLPADVFFSSRSCVWGVTARSILYAIRNGDVRCRPPLDTGAPARTRVHTSLSQATSFRTNGCPSPPLDGLGPPGRHRLRCHPIAYASTRRRARDQASACRISSFSRPMRSIPTAWLFIS